MKNTAILAILCIASSPSLAQTDINNDPSVSVQSNSNALEVITIAGINSGLPQPLVAGAVNVLSREDIEASGALTISDLLRTLPGVNFGQTGVAGSLSEVRLRGAESNHLLVLIDGVAINDLGQGSLVDFSHIQLSNVEKIEVLKGPQSALWGASAIAGVINITTHAQGSAKPSGRISISGGNKETYSASVNVAQQREKFGFNFSAEEYFTEGENISRDGNEADGYKNTAFNFGLRYLQNASNRFELTTRILDYTTDNDAYNFQTGFVSDANDSAKGEQLTFGFDWHFAPTNNGKKTGIYSQLLSIQYSEQDTNNFSNTIFSRSSSGETIRALWNNRLDFSKNIWLTVGLENTDQTFKQAEADPEGASNQKQTNSTQSVISSGMVGLAHNLTLTASYRYDNNSEFENEDSYRLGLNYLFNNNLKIFVSKGKAIQNPTFIERFGFFPGSFLGNSNLTPEQQNSTEVGFEVYTKHITYQISYFDAKLTNEILGFIFDAETGLFTAGNALENSERNGVELSVNGQLNNFNWQAQYSYLNASQNQEAELRRAKHTGSISTTYKIDDANQVYIQADYSGTKTDQFFPPFPEPSTLVNLDAYWLVSANYQLKYTDTVTLNARISNAFDESYEDVFGYNTDGRRALLSLQFTW